MYKQFFTAMLAAASLLLAGCGKEGAAAGGASDAPVRITIANDTATAKTALKNLVESYNALSSALTTMTAYDKDTKTAGTLQGDSTAVNLQSAMRRILSGPGGSGGEFSSLSQIGLAFQKDGTLKIDDTKLDKALKDPESLSKLADSNPKCNTRGFNE